MCDKCEKTKKALELILTDIKEELKRLEENRRKFAGNQILSIVIEEKETLIGKIEFYIKKAVEAI